MRGAKLREADWGKAPGFLGGQEGGGNDLERRGGGAQERVGKRDSSPRSWRTIWGKKVNLQPNPEFFEGSE